MTLSVFTDGGSRGNPGPASIGFVAHLGDKQIFSHHETIGIATNNVAEYTAIIRAFEMLSPKLEEWDVDIINFKSDQAWPSVGNNEVGADLYFSIYEKLYRGLQIMV